LNKNGLQSLKELKAKPTKILCFGEIRGEEYMNGNIIKAATR
jgi:hypothetical protein